MATVFAGSAAQLNKAMDSNKQRFKAIEQTSGEKHEDRND
jgi:hypothetical protein